MSVDRDDGFGRLLLLELSSGGAAAATDLHLFAGADIYATGSVVIGGAPVELLHELEVRVDGEIWEALERGMRDRGLELPVVDEWFDPRDYGIDSEGEPLRVSIYRPDPEQAIFTGRAEMSSARVEFRYEEWGSPDFGITVAIIWATLCAGVLIKDAVRGCSKEAKDACGARGVKKSRAKLSWGKGCTALCEYECN